MTIFVGVCRGGPKDNETFHHHERTCPVYRPMLEFSVSKPIGELAVEAVVMGTYEHRHGIWFWAPTT